MTGPAERFGSVGFVLSGIDGLAGTPGAGQSMWEALTDGTEVASLFDHPSELSFTGPGTTSSSANLPAGSVGDVATSIGVNLNFTLSPGETLGITGNFTIAPAPGALALLGIAGLAGRRRRRD